MSVIAIVEKVTAPKIDRSYAVIARDGLKGDGQKELLRRLGLTLVKEAYSTPPHAYYERNHGEPVGVRWRGPICGAGFHIELESKKYWTRIFAMSQYEVLRFR